MSYTNELAKMKKLLEERDENSEEMEETDDNKVEDYLRQTLQDIYKSITAETITKYKNYKRNKNLEELKKRELSRTDNISLKKQEAMTNKRLVEIKINKARKIQYNINVLKIALIVSGCFVVFPILTKLGILNKTMSLIIWAVCVLMLVLVILYFVYIHISDRNKNNFNKFNFQNPNSELIAKSKVNVDLSDKEYAKCKQYVKYKKKYDPDTINNFNITDYLTPGVDETGQCTN